MRRLAVVLAVVAILALVPTAAAVGTVDRLEPVDDSTPGQRSARELCTGQTGADCVNATLESGPFHCQGTNVSTFQCNVTYWLNLTVRGTATCGNASVNVSAELAVSGCTTSLEPIAHTTSGPVTRTYDGRNNTSRVANATAWVCLTETDCLRWNHDPILLPSWNEWQPKEITGGGMPTNHVICLGTSASLTEPRDLTPGCLESAIGTITDCSGRTGDAYYCDLEVYLVANPYGRRVCGSTQTSFGTGGKVLTCTFSSPRVFNPIEQIGPGVSRLVHTERYTNDEIPDDGRTIVIEGEVCAYAFQVGGERVCKTYHHVDHLPSDCCGVIEEDLVGYVETIARNTGVPVTVHP